MSNMKQKYTEEELKEQLDTAIEIAAHFHKGQRDKNNEIYLFHPIRIMMPMETYEEKMVAILHDVIEDTECTLEILQEKLGNLNVVEAMDAITRRNGEEYFTYIERVSKNPIARKIKIWDLRDNLSRRGASLELQERYKKALGVLLNDEKESLS